jgi:serine/threonine protein kinase
MKNIMSIVPNEPSKARSETCLAVGTRLAEFEITDLIGEGGFGIVYLAFDHSLQRTVAIKEYMPSALARRGADKSVVVRLQREQETFDAGLRSFINEARLLAQFDHPALVKVYRFWEENNTGYMAMRYYEGHTIKGVVKNNPALVTEAWLKGMLKPVLEALEALYRVQVLHRDISPDNIMIQENGEAVLLDFGAARQIIGDMNHAVTVILKPGYAPIEQYANDAAMAQGPWTDIYSLSAVVFFAIAKKPPPTSVVRMIKDPIERLQDGPHDGYSWEFLAALDKGMSVKPEERPQSIEEFRKMLRLELAVPVPTPGPRSASTLPASSHSSHSSKASQALRSPDSPKQSKADAPVAAAPAVAARVSTRGIPVLWISALLCGLGLAIAGYAAFRNKPQPAAAQLAQAKASKAPNAVPAPVIAESGQKEVLAAVPGPAASKPAAAEPAGTVRLNVKPWGTVYVDGVAKGVSPPLKKLELPEGKHQIKIVNPSFRNHTIDIDVTRKKTGSIDYDFSANKK